MLAADLEGCSLFISLSLYLKKKNLSLVFVLLILLVFYFYRGAEARPRRFAGHCKAAGV
jgi:hypothetical protein